MKIIHYVALNFIQFLGAILDCGFRIDGIASLYHFLLNWSTGGGETQRIQFGQMPFILDFVYQSENKVIRGFFQSHKLSQFNESTNQLNLQPASSSGINSAALPGSSYF